eukprot:10468033-Lingulodinium_polyedra.AAC.1
MRVLRGRLAQQAPELRVACVVLDREDARRARVQGIKPATEPAAPPAPAISQLTRQTGAPFAANHVE